MRGISATNVPSNLRIMSEALIQESSLEEYEGFVRCILFHLLLMIHQWNWSLHGVSSKERYGVTRLALRYPHDEIRSTGTTRATE